MAIRLTRRTLLAAGAYALTGAAGADADAAADAADPAPAADAAGVDAAAAAYAGFRLVADVPGEPSTPEVVLPPGYAPVPGAQYTAASRAEFLQFVQGPPAAGGIPVSVRWPGRRIATVIAGERRLALTPDPADPYRVGFRLPVVRTSAAADSPTVQVWSHLSAPATGLYWHVEHNDPDRAAGYWARVAWPAVQTAAVVSYMAAAEAVLRDSGLIAQARERRHFFALMGFETNNPLHQDNPPHWHLSYYPGPTMGAARATVPHFWIDAQGRTFYNGQDVQGGGRTPYRAGQPAPILDAAGGLVVTTTIRADGGLDIDPPAGPRYSIVSPTGSFGDPLVVERDGLPWRSVRTSDDVREGRLYSAIRGFERRPVAEVRTRRYDPLTGPLLS